jgi:outer membrane protein assembly factor BamB
LRGRLRILLLPVLAAASLPALSCAAGPGTPPTAARETNGLTSGTAAEAKPSPPPSANTTTPNAANAPQPDDIQPPRVLAGALWRFRAGGPVRTTPVLSDGLVLVASDDGVLHALDARDGAERWQVGTDGASVSSPAVHDGLVVFASGDRIVRAVRQTTGEEIWRFRTGPGRGDGADGGEHRVPSPVAIADQFVVAGEDGFLAALDTPSGRVAWRFDTGAPVRSSPRALGDTIFVANTSGRLSAVDAATGLERWRFVVPPSEGFAASPATGAAMLSSPAITPREVLLTAGDGRAYALDRLTGRVLWTHRGGATSTLVSPAAARGLAFMGGGEGAGFEADRLDDGDTAWRFAGAPGASAATVAGGLVLFGTESRTLFALEAESGREAWRFPSTEAIVAAPAIATGRVFFGNDAGEVFALAGPGAHGSTSWIPWRAVYFDPSIHGAYEGADVLAEILRGRGYLRLDARTLPAFLEARLGDAVPSVVVFASVVAPRGILEPRGKTALVRRYLDAGGRIVWPGIVPFGFFTDPDDDRPALDPKASERALGVRQSRTPKDEERATATPEGQSLGLPAWWLAVMPAEPCDVTTILGEDADGKALAWVKAYGHGGRFVRLGGQGQPLDDPALVWRTAESDLPRTGIPDPFDLRFIAGGTGGSGSGSGADHAAPDRVTHQTRGVVDLELPCQAHPVRLHRLDADAEQGGDLLHRLPLGDQLQHLPLAGAQGIGRSGRAVEMRPQDVAGHPGAQVEAPARHLPDGAHQVFRRPRLQEIP